MPSRMAVGEYQEFPRGCSPTTRMLHRNPTNFDALFLRVSDNQRGSIKAHRQGINQSRGERFRVVALDEAGIIGDQCERRRMAFWKAVAAESFELLERLLPPTL